MLQVHGDDPDVRPVSPQPFLKAIQGVAALSVSHPENLSGMQIPHDGQIALTAGGCAADHDFVDADGRDSLAGNATVFLAEIAQLNISYRMPPRPVVRRRRHHSTMSFLFTALYCFLQIDDGQTSYKSRSLS